MNTKSKRDHARDLIDILQMKKSKNGFYQTSWGKKTEKGLIETICNIMAEDNHLE